MLLLLSHHPQFSSPSGEIGTNPNQPSPFHFSSFSSEQTPTSSELANQNLSMNRCQQVEIDQISHRQAPMDNSKQHQKLQPTQNQCECIGAAGVASNVYEAKSSGTKSSNFKRKKTGKEVGKTETGEGPSMKKKRPNTKKGKWVFQEERQNQNEVLQLSNVETFRS